VRREILLNMETLTMKRVRLKLSSLLLLVVLAAVFMAGVRYGEYRTESNRQSARGYAISVSGGKIVRHVSDVEFKTDHPKLTPEK
jgi:hypothetical protein